MLLGMVGQVHAMMAVQGYAPLRISSIKEGMKCSQASGEPSVGRLLCDNEEQANEVHRVAMASVEAASSNN